MSQKFNSKLVESIELPAGDKVVSVVPKGETFMVFTQHGKVFQVWPYYEAVPQPHSQEWFAQRAAQPRTRTQAPWSY